MYYEISFLLFRLFFFFFPPHLGSARSPMFVYTPKDERQHRGTQQSISLARRPRLPQRTFRAHTQPNYTKRISNDFSEGIPSAKGEERSESNNSEIGKENNVLSFSHVSMAERAFTFLSHFLFNLSSSTAPSSFPRHHHILLLVPPLSRPLLLSQMTTFSLR